MTESDIAKSLLAYDVRLFRRVIPWQCLGSVWSRREQRSSSEIHTVKATVKQFNHVVYIVLATVLSPCLSLTQRAKIVEKVMLYLLFVEICFIFENLIEKLLLLL